VEDRAESFYQGLSRNYESKIRQLVPRYKELVATLIDLVVLASPKRVLDLGCGAGELEVLLCRRLPEAEITAVDRSEDMLEVARTKLLTHNDLDCVIGRVNLVQENLLDFYPSSTFDAVFSNLVLHNLLPDSRRIILRRVQDWIDPCGVFLWGDLIRLEDPVIQGHFREERVNYARSTGCPKELVRENFLKEETSDTPWTVLETLVESKKAGFRETELVWAHDTFALFHLRK
jgi:ubiquinone/menaquinone biosynthesis C-methylase UbiE